ncbi:MAG: hypothetical protein ACW98Y_16475 [Candidatus Thorarchaeota archaeon]|jgi:hypothetical protein
MHGKYILLMLSHLFRKCGEQVNLDDAVYRLAFDWRYGTPSNIRRLLALANENEMISYSQGIIKAEFLFSTQQLDPNQADILSRQVKSVSGIEPLY